MNLTSFSRHTSAAALLLLATPALAQQTQPVAPVREIVDTYFGHSVTDPYRWMESKRGHFEMI